MLRYCTIICSCAHVGCYATFILCNWDQLDSWLRSIATLQKGKLKPVLYEIDGHGDILSPFAGHGHDMEIDALRKIDQLAARV